MFYVFGPDGVVTNRNPREGGAKLLADFCGGTFKSGAGELTDDERAAVAEYEASVGKLTTRERYGLTEGAAAILLGEEAAGLGEYPPNDPDGMREFLLTQPEPGV